MAGPFNILAQVVPAAAVETTLYQAQEKTKAIVQEVAVCNRSGAPVRFRLSVSLLGVVTTTKDYLYYDLTVQGNDTFAAELELTLNAFDIIRVYASTADLTFTLFGNPT